MSIDDLKSLCKEKGIKKTLRGKSIEKAKKGMLIAVLEKNDKEGQD
jgi:hypothetical protein